MSMILGIFAWGWSCCHYTVLKLTTHFARSSPWGILYNAGGAFVLGSVCSALWHSIKGAYGSVKVRMTCYDHVAHIIDLFPPLKSIGSAIGRCCFSSQCKSTYNRRAVCSVGCTFENVWMWYRRHSSKTRSMEPCNLCCNHAWCSCCTWWHHCRHQSNPLWRRDIYIDTSCRIPHLTICKLP